MPFPDKEIADEIELLREEVKRLRAALNRLTPGLATLLKLRGFIIYKKEPSDDLLIPSKNHINSYYRMLHKYSFRLFLRDVIKYQNGFNIETVTRYATSDVTESYIDYLVRIRLLHKRGQEYSLVKRPVRSFGVTLEWYVAELVKREFGAEAVWGVKFRRPKVGGDYDVIAKLEGKMFYAEVKSSPPKQIYDSEIAAFLDRVDDLAPEIAVFLMDTELRMKDKIVPMFEKELGSRIREAPELARIERELFRIGNRIFIINAKEDILGNLSKLLYHHYRNEKG